MKSSFAWSLLAAFTVAPAVGQVPERSWHPIFGPAKPEVEAFCRKIVSTSQDRISVAVLPFVYADRTKEQNPWKVTDGGVEIANGVVDLLRGVVPEADILNLTDLELRFGDTGQRPCTFRDANAVRDGGHHLGVDLIIFGRIVKREKNGGATLGTELFLEMRAIPVGGGGTAKLDWIVGSQDSIVRRLFESLDRESEDWTIADAWQVKSEDSLGGAVKSMKRQFSGRVGRVIGNGGIVGGGKPAAEPTTPSAEPETPGAPGSKPPSNPPGQPQPVKPKEPRGSDEPPVRLPVPGEPRVRWDGRVPAPSVADSSVLVVPASFAVLDQQQRLVLDMRAEYDQKWRKVLRSADSSHELPNPNQQVVLGKTQYESFTAAKADIDSLAEKVHSSKAGEYCEQLSREITDALIKQNGGGKVLSSELLGQSLATELTSRLESGSLGEADGRSLAESLRAIGLGIVVVPYLEDCGSYYALRARIVNLRQPTEVHTVFVTISSKFKEDLAAQLNR